MDMSAEVKRPVGDTATPARTPRVSTERRLFGYLSFQFAGTMVSRLAGFVRELVTSAYYGAGSAADAFIAALTIPTLFRDILGEDVVERSFMPGIRENLARRQYERAWRLASASLNWLLVGTAIVTVFVWYAAPWLVEIVAQGIHNRQVDEGTFADVVHMTRILTPFILFIALAAYVGGLLFYAFDLHLVFSLAPASLSVGVIVAVVFFSDTLGVFALAYGFLAGAALEFLVQVPFLRARRIRATEPRYTATLRPPDQGGRRMWKQTGHVTLQSILTKTTEVVDRRVASFLATGSISSLWFAYRLIQLPNAIIGIAVGRSIAPYLSEQQGLGDRAEFKKAVLIGYRYNLLFILPAIALMVVLAEPIIRLVFQRGAFNAHDTATTALAFWCYAVGLLGMSLFTLASRVCSALEANRVATVTSAIGAGLNIWLNYVLSATALKHGGLALATSIAWTVNSTLLFAWLHRYLKRTESGFTVAELVGPAARVVANSALAALLAWATYHGLIARSAWLMSDAFVAESFAVALPFGIGMASYIVASLANPIPEVMPAVRRLRRRTTRTQAT